MARIAKIVLVAWLIITFLIAVPVLITLARDSVTDGPLARTATPRVLLGSGRSSVQLDFVPDASTCPAIPLSIFLLIDKSGSMNDGNAFPQAREAATAFINSVDLTQSSVAVAFFDEFPTLVQPATQDRAALLAAVDSVTIPDGGTNIAGALQLASDNLGTEKPVIILLTDGSVPDYAGTMAVADAVKARGAHLVTVAVGSFADVINLGTLASSSNSALASEDPAALRAIYTELAEQLSAVVGTNLIITEPVDSAFTTLPDTIAPSAVQSGQDLIWQAGIVPSTGLSFRYDVMTGGLGWHPVTSEAATMSFIDCQTGLATLSLATGPRILVLPGPAFWIPWALALLLPVFLLFRGRKGVIPPSPLPQPVTPPPTAAPDQTPAWLRRLDTPAKMLGLANDASESGDLVPTIIVGLGPVGRIVLSQVAQALNGRFARRDQLPVRLLQVDVQPMSGPDLTRPDYLLPDEWVLLRADFHLISGTLQSQPELWEHMDWYEPTAAAGYGRARGRMALFYDLRNGADNSVIYRGLKTAATNMNKPRLRVVSSTFDDVGSGMLIDISWLMWLATSRNVDVELWLTGPVNRDWSPQLSNPGRALPQSEQRVRTLATLREIARFQRNAVVPLHYVPRNMGQEEFHQVVDSAVVQTLFLFEAKGTTSSVEDHLATLTDSLIALLNPSVQKEVTEHLGRFQAKAGELVNRTGEGLVCGMGAYAVTTPLAALREALAWRLVHDLVCEARTGLLPGRLLKSDGKYDAQNPDTASGAPIRRTEVEDFIEGHRAFLHDDRFRQAVAAWIANLMNGEDGDTPALARSGGIRRARKCVDMLRTVLRQEGEESAALPLTDLSRELETWDTFLGNDLCPATAERLEAARGRLRALATQGGRSWSIDEKLEWPSYQADMRSWLDRPSRAMAGEAIVRAAQRFGWQVGYDPVSRSWPVELWIPDGEFIWAGQPIGPGQLSAPRDSAVILDRLYQLALPLAFNAKSNADVLSHAARMDSRTWIEAAAPRLSVNDMTITRLLAGANSIYPLLAARQTDTTARILGALKGTGNAQAVVGCATDDTTTVTLLRVRDRVPMSAVFLYGDDRDGNNAWDMNSVTPAHYVWRGEQIAAEHESGQRIGSRFVGFLERDEKLVDLYARAVLFGLYKATRDGVAISDAEGWAWPGTSPGNALVNLFSVDSTGRPPALDDNLRAASFKTVENLIARSIADIESETGLAGFRREAERVLQLRPRPRHEMESVEPWQLDYEEYFRSLAGDATDEDRDLRLYMLQIISTLQY